MVNESGEQKKKSILEKSHYAVTAMLTLAAGYSQLQLSNQEVILKEQEAKIRASEELRKQHESDAQLTFKLYEEVKSALLDDRDPEKRQLIALKLVEELATESFKTRLITVIRDATPIAGIKAKASTAAYESESEEVVVRLAELQPVKASVNALSNRTSTWSNWDFDFFWCESSGEKAKQEAFEALTIKDAAATGRWRVRMLPNSINAQSGYGISGYQVRINQDELEVGNRLSASLASAISPGRSFVIHEVRNLTPYYVSVFFCPPHN